MRKTSLWLLLIPALAGCAGEQVLSENPPELDCVTRGYPCSLADVPLEVLAHSADLGRELTLMLEGGTTTADALAWLADQEGVAESAGDADALYFRLKGGRPVWILTQDALAIGVDPSASHPGKASSADKSTLGLSQHVVGNDPDTKHALVLAPFAYQFGQYDDGIPVTTLLANARGYSAETVTYLENSSKTGAQVGISNFKGWQNYDIIHVSSHGKTVCDEKGQQCNAMISTGDVWSTPEDLQQIVEAGVNTAHVVGSDATFHAVDADFFRSQYPGGLDNKIVFFNACQTLGKGDNSLGESLAGTRSVYFGWSHTVHASVATNAAILLYTDMVNNGVTAADAWEALGEAGVDNYEKDGEPIAAILLIERTRSRDERAREVVRLEHPDGGALLTSGSVIVAEGKAGDGIPDNVPYQVFIEGIAEEDQDRAVVQVTLGGYGSTPQTISAGERVGAKGWRLSGSFPYIDLATNQLVTLTATLQLPEGGTSRHTVTFALLAEPAEPDSGSGADVDVSQPEGVERWNGSVTSNYKSPIQDLEVTMSANFTFVMISEPGMRYKHFEIEHGTLKWTQSGKVKRFMQDDCDYLTGPVTMDIKPSEGGMMIDRETGEYTMHGTVKGPSVKAAEACEDYAFTTQAGGVWLPPIISSDHKVVTGGGDGGAISGNITINNHSWSWTLSRQ